MLVAAPGSSYCGTIACRPRMSNFQRMGASKTMSVVKKVSRSGLPGKYSVNPWDLDCRTMADLRKLVDLPRGHRILTSGFRTEP